MSRLIDTDSCNDLLYPLLQQSQQSRKF
ncbi:hypothetical protein [Escherichia phage dw-ec]|nr:hypothetical protein [Escherichia phage BI-EHEC]UJQ43722.1 hypothetical protein [Escherichia phage dw-ec]